MVKTRHGEPRRVLVTGGAGFIGSHVVDELVTKGCEVTVLDALHPAAHSERPAYLNEHAEYVWGDVRDAETVERCVRGADAVAHHAAMVGAGVDFDDAVDYVSNNDGGTAVLLRALHRTGFRGRLVLASSMVVYGEGAYRCPEHGAVRPGPRDPGRLDAGLFDPPCPACGRDLESEAVTEEASPDPRNVYGATKVMQELLCRAFAREHGGVDLTILRYHNVYGPRMPRNTPYAGVASIFRSALEAGHPPEVFEDGRQLRDFVHVRDVARATLMALSSEVATGTFNVASGSPRAVGELADALADAFGPDGPRPRVTGRFRLGDVRHVFASTDLLERSLGFRTTIPFEVGVAELARASLRASVI